MSIYRFAEFELDLDAQQLRLRGHAVHLERRPFDLLVLLVTRHGRMVTREDIVAALWQTRVIIDFESGLNTLVRKVRKALGDSPDNPTFIETVPGRGYRFIAPVTPPADADSAPVAAPVAARRKFFPMFAVVIATVILVGGTVFVLQPEFAKDERTRIVVLPFENLTGNEELGYLASGIAEEVNTSLTQIDLPDLSVIGLVSAAALANSGEPLDQIGRDFDVDFIVKSSLRLERSRIRVASRLIRVADNEQIWSASFDRELTNVLGLQRELSIAIAEQIRQRLSPSVAAAIDRRQTQNPVAYELYLKGRYAWTQFQPDSVRRAVEFYRQAVALDPGYALAWAGIAHALVTSLVTVEARPESFRAAAQDALQRAMEFGPDLAETQLALASFHFFLDLNYADAEPPARQAVALDPNSAMCHMFLGIVLAQRQEHVESRAMLRRARELDPLFPLMFANSATAAITAGDYDDAVEFATQAIAINPEFWVGYMHLGRARLALGELNAALEAFTDAERFSGGRSSRSVASRAYALALLGRESDARDILSDLMVRSADGHVPPQNIAAIYAGLGETDMAFEWLDHAFAQGNSVCLGLLADERFASLQGDLRFESVRRRCNAGAGTGVFE